MEQLERIRLFANEMRFELDRAQLELYEAYASWLAHEAVTGGGIGPNELESLLDRHLLDSLTFLAPLEQAPRTLVDIGSGVGLPGVPLAIALTDTQVVLIDRSGRRCALLRRAVRILGIENLEVVEADVSEFGRTTDAVVSRASLTPPELLPHLRRMTELGIVAGSTRTEPDVAGYRTLKIASRYLETPRWLLIMQAS